MKPERQLSPPPFFNTRARDRVCAALRSGQWANGPRALSLERKIAERIGVHPGQVVCTSSATAALAAATDALYGEHDQLFVCPLTWPSTYSSWTREVRWVDCRDNDPFNSMGQPDIMVDLWGREVHIEPKTKILDAAHRFGDPRHGSLLSSGLCAVVYSFAPQKEVPCWAGGAVVFRDPDLAVESRIFLNSGTRERVWAGEPGVKGLMDDVTAGFLGESLSAFEERKAKRLELLDEYWRHLGGRLYTPPSLSSGHLCVVKAPGPVVRGLWRRALDLGKVAHGHHYPITTAQGLACPNAESISQTVLTLPLHIGMDRGAVRRVCMRLLSA